MYNSAVNSNLVLDVGRVLFVGPLGALPAHQTSASALVVGMERSFDLIVDDITTSHRVAYVPSKTLHAVDFHGARSAVLFFDPGTAPLEAVYDEAQLISAIDQALKPNSAETWKQLLRAAHLTANPPTVDARLAAIATRLIQSSDEGLLATDLAVIAHLSTSRLEHLFKAQFGVPVRAFRNWYRFRLAAKHLLSGDSITDAAHAAGFHDAAHFSHAFRDTFGLPPSHVFTPNLQGYCLE
jgi:AraC-like DNA-binding protein